MPYLCRTEFRRRRTSEFIPKRHRPEQALQEMIVRWLDEEKILFCASAGGMRTSMQVAIKMKRAGYKKGFPDLFISEPTGRYAGMFIEVKCGSYATKEQKWWQEELSKRGYYAVIIPANLDIITAFGWIKKEVGYYLGLKTL